MSVTKGGIVLNPDDHPDFPAAWLSHSLRMLEALPRECARPGVIEHAAGLLVALELDPFVTPRVEVKTGGILILTFSGPAGRELTLSFRGKQGDGGHLVEFLLWRPDRGSLVARLAPAPVESFRRLAREIFPLSADVLARSLEWMPEVA